jgi:predicted SAM-dependent methyltransferase
MKIHIGCGKRNFGEHWIHIDGAKDDELSSEKYFKHIKHNDITKLPFLDNTADMIYASHVIAYFNRSEILDVLTEWRRVLKPGAILRLATPDFESIVKLYTEKQYHLASFTGLLYGKMKMGNETIYHKTVYDFKSLLGVLMLSKFRDIKRYDWKLTSHAHIDDHSQAYLPHLEKNIGTLMSINVECIK